jgi:hypothetical protein
VGEETMRVSVLGQQIRSSTLHTRVVEIKNQSRGEPDMTCSLMPHLSSLKCCTLTRPITLRDARPSIEGLPLFNPAVPCSLHPQGTCCARGLVVCLDERS